MNFDSLKRAYDNHSEAFKQTYGMDSGLALLIDGLAVALSAFYLYRGVGTIVTILCSAVIAWVVFDRGRSIVGGDS